GWGSIVEENAEPARAVEPRALPRDGFNQERMLGDREDVRALGLPVPAGDAREPMGDVRDLHVERRGVEQVEPPSGQHALPSAKRRGGYDRSRAGRHRVQRPAKAAKGACRWQLTRWSLTMPVACMKA